MTPRAYLELDVVFSGSSTKLEGHAGAASYIDDQPDILVKRLAGTSGGAIVAALWATVGAREGAKILKSLKFSDYVSLNWMSFLNFVVNGYAGSGWAYYNDLKKYFGDTTFADVPKDLSIVVSNMTLGKAEVWHKATHSHVKLRDALYVSSCIPGIFKPINVHNMLYRDGGVYWNFPINLWKNYPRPRIGFLFDGEWKPSADDAWNGLKELRLALDRSIDSNVDLSVLDVSSRSEVFVTHLPTLGLGPLDFSPTEDQRKSLFEGGQRAAAQTLDHVRRIANIHSWTRVL